MNIEASEKLESRETGTRACSSGRNAAGTAGCATKRIKKRGSRRRSRPSRSPERRGVLLSRLRCYHGTAEAAANVVFFGSYGRGDISCPQRTNVSCPEGSLRGKRHSLLLLPYCFLRVFLIVFSPTVSFPYFSSRFTRASSLFFGPRRSPFISRRQPVWSVCSFSGYWTPEPSLSLSLLSFHLRFFFLTVALYRDTFAWTNVGMTKVSGSLFLSPLFLRNFRMDLCFFCCFSAL